MTSLSESATISQRETARRSRGEAGGAELESRGRFPARDGVYILPPLHAARRNRRAAQRRQVHPLQRPHPHPQGRGGELSLLHDRAQRRRRDRARRAPRAAREDRRRPSASSRPPSSSWTSPASSRAQRRAKGLGNKFLTHIREVDAIVQVVRCFEDTDIIHVAGQSTRSPTSRRSRPSSCSPTSRP